MPFVSARTWYSPVQGMKRRLKDIQGFFRIMRQIPMREWPAFVREAYQIFRDKANKQSYASQLRGMIHMGIKAETARQYLRALHDPDFAQTLKPSQRILLDVFKPGLGGMMANDGTRALQNEKLARWRRAVKWLRVRRLIQKRNALRTARQHAQLAARSGAIRIGSRR